MTDVLFDPSLPSYFSAWCDSCGWRGCCRQGHVYVFGAAYPIVYEAEVKNTRRCPSCDRAEVRRRADLAMLIKRLKWHASHFTHKDEGRGPGKKFDCRCPNTPPPLLVGAVEVKEACYGDTTFSSDQSLLRAVAEVRCSSCFASAPLALVEGHDPRDIDVQDRPGGPYRKAWVPIP